MRIISGTAGGRRIAAPEGRGTRPTTDKVREAVFSMTGGYMDGETVLDVFAGSGAMALEAISRGADKAVMIDSSRQAAAVIKKNTSDLGFDDRCTLLNRDWKLAFPSLRGEKFSLVIIDPPYKLVETYIEVLNALVAQQLLTDGAVLVLEHETKVAWQTFPQGFTPRKPHKYGDTAVTVLDYSDAAERASEVGEMQ